MMTNNDDWLYDATEMQQMTKKANAAEEILDYDVMNRIMKLVITRAKHGSYSFTIDADEFKNELGTDWSNAYWIKDVFEQLGYGCHITDDSFNVWW